MTAGILKTIEDMTGTYVPTCPWRSLSDPFVRRVFDAMPFFESGQLDFALPNPSHRLVEGIKYFRTVSNSVYAKLHDLKKKNAATPAPIPAGLPADRFGAKGAGRRGR